MSQFLAESALYLGEHAQSYGPILGPLYLTLGLTFWVVVCLPCSFVEMIPGFLFGVRTGWLVSMAGKSIGSALSMYLGRYVFKDSFEKWLFIKYPVLRKVGLAVEKEGFPFLIFIRGMWLPIALKNYGLAVLNVPISHALLAGFLTSIPHSLLWAWLGSKMNNLAEVLQGSGKISISDVIPQNDLIIIGIPIAAGCFIVARNFYYRFNSLLNEDD